MGCIINMSSSQWVEMKIGQQKFSYSDFIYLFFILSIIQGQVRLKHYLALSNECAVFESVDTWLCVVAQDIEGCEKLTNP